MTATRYAGPERWPASRKASIVALIARGDLSKAEAMSRYHLSPEELQEWQNAYHGQKIHRPGNVRIHRWRTNKAGRLVKCKKTSRSTKQLGSTLHMEPKRNQ